MKTACLVIVAVAFSLSFAAYAQNTVGPGPETSSIHTIQLPVIPVDLKPGAGMDKASTLCNICHSTDYITMQPPFPRATWSAEVNKMIKAMGAPLGEEDAKTIVDYLVKNYGTGN